MSTTKTLCAQCDLSFY